MLHPCNKTQATPSTPQVSTPMIAMSSPAPPHSKIFCGPPRCLSDCHQPRCWGRCEPSKHQVSRTPSTMAVKEEVNLPESKCGSCVPTCPPASQGKVDLMNGWLTGPPALAAGIFQGKGDPGFAGGVFHRRGGATRAAWVRHREKVAGLPAGIHHMRLSAARIERGTGLAASISKSGLMKQTAGRAQMLAEQCANLL